MTLVYALAAPAAPIRGRGMTGERLRTITVGRLTAIVGDVGRAPKPTTANALRYDAVMQRLAAAVPALLPVRFGTQVDGEELAFILKSRAASMRSGLRHVRNRVQMTVRVFGVATDAKSQSPNPKSRIPNSKSQIPNAQIPNAQIPNAKSRGADYLRQRAASQRVAELDPLRDAVRRWIRDEKVERRERMVTLYHLVPRASARAYAAAVTAAARDQRLRVLISGPHPPYAFAEI